MNIIAIAANIVQLLIILVIFSVRGLELGPLVIFLLFLLMPIALINGVALLLEQHRSARTTVDGQGPDGIIKRQSMRVMYRADHRATLHIEGTAYAVVDLSEGGVRISAGANTPFKKKIGGEIRLVCGERIHFKAVLLRRDEGETAFQFTDPVGTAVLLAEKNALAVHPP